MDLGTDGLSSTAAVRASASPRVIIPVAVLHAVHGFPCPSSVGLEGQCLDSPTRTGVESVLGEPTMGSTHQRSQEQDLRRTNHGINTCKGARNQISGSYLLPLLTPSGNEGALRHHWTPPSSLTLVPVPHTPSSCLGFLPQPCLLHLVTILLHLSCS